MVLVAGRGERMRPLSAVLPKPALPVLDRPLASWALAQAARAGCRRVVANTWHLGEVMARALEGAVPEGVELAVSREDQLMGTAGGLGLARARGLLGDDGPVLLLNGDGVLELDLEPVLERHRRGDALATMALLPHLDPRRWSRVHLDRDDRVTEIAPPGEPAPGEAPFVYPGAMVIAREALARLPEEPGELRSALLEPAMASGCLLGVVVSGLWREVGTPTAYLEAVLARLAGHTWVDPGATVEPGAVLGEAMIGRRVRIAADAVVAESVVAEGAVVERGARVIRSVVLGPVTVPAGAVLTHDVRVP